jgi:hypothetical protein
MPLNGPMRTRPCGCHVFAQYPRCARCRGDARLVGKTGERDLSAEKRQADIEFARTQSGGFKIAA